MAKFSFNDYQNAIAKAQSGSNNLKVGFFKLANDGDEALARLFVRTVEDLQFATVHTISAGGKWLKVSCLNPLGSYTANCPLCAAADAGKSSISKAKKQVYIQMVVSYHDRATNTWSAPVPVVWERSASYSREIATKLSGYGPLTEHVFKITRNGKAGDLKTTYSMDCLPIYDNEQSVPKDFSAFANFNIAKHSYWEKTVEEINTFLTTGSFPEVIRTNTQASAPVVESVQPTYAAPAQPVYAAPAAPVQAAQPVYTTPVAPAPAVQPTQTFNAPPTPVAQPEQPKPATPTGASGFNVNNYNF